jgi:hypothetical protein
VAITFTSLKSAGVNVTLTAPPSQTFHALKARLSETTGFNVSALRFLIKNKAINDSKSVQEVFGEALEGHVTVMVMKTPSATNAVTGPKTGAVSDEGEKMVIENEGFWEGIREVVLQKYSGSGDKEEVLAALKKGYQEKFGST